MAKAGRPPVRHKWPQWCREAVMRPEVLEALAERCLTDTDFAVRLAEHGFGRPNQALQVRHGGIEGEAPIEFKITFDDGAAYTPTSNATSSTVEAVPTEVPE